MHGLPDPPVPVQMSCPRVVSCSCLHMYSELSVCIFPRLLRLSFCPVRSGYYILLYLLVAFRYYFISNALNSGLKSYLSASPLLNNFGIINRISSAYVESTPANPSYIYSYGDYPWTSKVASLEYMALYFVKIAR
jgi:hypothetical protein